MNAIGNPVSNDRMDEAGCDANWHTSDWRIADCGARRNAEWAIDQVVLDMADQGYGARDCRAMRVELRHALHRSASPDQHPARTMLRYLVRPERTIATFQDPDPVANRPADDEFTLASLEREFRNGQATMGHYATWVRYDRRGDWRALCRYRDAAGLG